MSLWDGGQATSWSEIIALTRAAISDPSTRLGAKAAGWDYPASMVELYGLIAKFGDTATDILPFPAGKDGDDTDIDAVAEAQQQLDAEFTF